MSVIDFAEALAKEISTIEKQQLELEAKKILAANKLKTLLSLPTESKLPASVTSHINGIAIKNVGEEFQKRSGSYAESPSSIELVKVWFANNQHLSSFPSALARRQVELKLTKQKPIAEEAIRIFILTLNDLSFDNSSTWSSKNWFLQWYNDNVKYGLSEILPVL